MNPFELLKDFKNIQEKAALAKENLQQISAIGSSGGGMVVVELNGEFEPLRVNIDKVIFSQGDERMLEDLILSAFSQAAKEIREKIQGQAASLIPGGADFFNSMMGGNK